VFTCAGCTNPIKDDDEVVEGVFSNSVETQQAGHVVVPTPVYYHPECWPRHPLGVNEGRRGLLEGLTASA